jgi:hypothetical protein
MIRNLPRIFIQKFLINFPGKSFVYHQYLTPTSVLRKKVYPEKIFLPGIFTRKFLINFPGKSLIKKQSLTLSRVFNARGYQGKLFLPGISCIIFSG